MISAGNQGRLRISRTLALALLSVAAGAGYFLAIVGAAKLLQAEGGLVAAVALFVLPLVSAVAAGALLPSRHTQSWLRVMVAKHLFAHRYDYRTEWLRFNATLSRPDAQAPLHRRTVKAIADLVASPGGVLLLPEGDGLTPRADWHWYEDKGPAGAAFVELLREGRTLTIDTMRDGDDSAARATPEWLAAAPAAWVVVPLIHLGTLVGGVVLARPPAKRALDWEDFDLLRVGGAQAASYLAEARTQEALGDAARFEEFNRRFAFIIHDIKNLVSQLTLVTRNAERHADKPEFRADMIATLQSSTARMNDLLQRLSQHNRVRAAEPRVTEIHAVAAAVAATMRRRHPVIVAGDRSALAMVDPARLDQALSHLVQNAIDASPAAEPVTLTLLRGGGETGIEIADRGCGMTQDFVHQSLFRPFTSTKAGGFGIGAHEAKTLIAAMGGRIAVASVPGEGSRFTIWLPTAELMPDRQVA